MVQTFSRLLVEGGERRVELVQVRLQRLRLLAQRSAHEAPTALVFLEDRTTPLELRLSVAPLVAAGSTRRADLVG